MIKPGSVLVVECLDRLSRQRARHAVKIVEAIVDAGVGVYSTLDRQLYTAKSLDDGPMQLIMMILVFVRANEESQRKSDRGSRRWIEARQNARSNGTQLPARTPWWIAKTTTGHALIADRAATVKRIAAMAMDGLGSVRIAAALNADGIVSASGNLRSTKAIENAAFAQDAGLYDFHRGWMEEIFVSKGNKTS